jgi:hypothetical protein
VEANTTQQAAAADVHRRTVLARLQYPDLFQDFFRPNQRQLTGGEIMQLLTVGRCAGLDDNHILQDVYRINDRRAQYA